MVVSAESLKQPTLIIIGSAVGLHIFYLQFCRLIACYCCLPTFQYSSPCPGGCSGSWRLWQSWHNTQERSLQHKSFLLFLFLHELWIFPCPYMYCHPPSLIRSWTFRQLPNGRGKQNRIQYLWVACDLYSVLQKPVKTGQNINLLLRSICI